MEEIHIPRQPAARPLTTEPEASDAITVTPSTAIQKRCEGPNPSAHCASTGVKKMSTSTPSTPPTPEARKLSCSACAARPCCTMRCLSKVVAMFAGAPGILSRIALTAPPATVAVYTYPSRISPLAGVMWKVKGMSRATAMVGLRPGRAPMISPPHRPHHEHQKVERDEDVAHVVQELGQAPFSDAMLCTNDDRSCPGRTHIDPGRGGRTIPKSSATAEIGSINPTPGPFRPR